MIGGRVINLAALAFWATSPLLAEISSSPVPQARPGPTANILAVQPFTNVTGLGAFRPAHRPSFSPPVTSPAAQTAPTTVAAPVVAAPKTGLLRSPRPQSKPNVRLAAKPVVEAAPAPQKQSQTAVKYRKKGSVCGVKEIRGAEIAPIPGKLPGCGVQSPVQITEVAGVKLSSPARINCDTAKALHSWIEKGVKPAVGSLGGGVSELRVAASFSCRTRNSQPGAKISEHGKGRAIDISAVRLKNGITLSVLKGWNDPVQGKLLKKMHKSACGPFKTVLGPNSDRFHKDHFHFDTAKYRGGSYCR